MKIAMENICKSSETIPLSSLVKVRLCECCVDASNLIYSIDDDKYVLDDSLYTSDRHYHLDIYNNILPIDYLCSYLNHHLYLHKKIEYERINNLPAGKGKIVYDENINSIGYILDTDDSYSRYDTVDIYAANASNINIHLISISKWEFIMEKNKQLSYYMNIYF
jgi:hypothetical protein